MALEMLCNLCVYSTTGYVTALQVPPRSLACTRLKGSGRCRDASWCKRRDIVLETLKHVIIMFM